MTFTLRHDRLSCGPCVAAVISALLTRPVDAQTTASADDSGGGLQEIVVTAQKRSENMQTVPISISALSSEQLASQRITNATQIAAQVPNLQITTPFNDAIPVFSLRGVSAIDYSQNQSSPVALYVDEVYKGLGVFTSLQMFDLERVEVLRGPQGTLYGKNTTGGAVNIYTKGPNLAGGFSGNITAGVGNLNRREAEGGLNVPIISEVLAARVAFTVTKAHGYVRNLYPGGQDQNSIDDRAVRVSLAFQPTDSLRATWRYTNSKSTPTGYGVLADNIGIKGPGGAGFGTGYTRQGLDFWENEADRTGLMRIKNESMVLTVNWDFLPNAALTSISSYDSGSWLTEEDYDGTPFNLLHDDYLSRAVAWSQDLRLASTGTGRLKWLVGAYFYRDRVLSSQVYRYDYALAGYDANGQLLCLDDGFTGCRYDNDFKQTRRSTAFYTQESYELSDRLRLTAGLRYTRDRNHLDNYRAWLGYLDPASNTEVIRAFPTITTPPVDRADNSNVSGKVGIDFQPTDQSLIYATVSRGYRGASFNGQALQSPAEVTVAQPERLDAYEIGIKTQTDDRKLRVNGAVFYYKYRNQQFIDITPQLLQILYNAPRSRIRGAEMELVARPVAHFGMRFGASYLDTRYQQITLRGQDLAGKRLIVAPRWTVMGGLDWQLLTSRLGSLSLHTDSRYTSTQFYDAFNTEESREPSYILHDARLTYASAATPLSVSTWIKNITNKEYRTYRLRLSDSFNFDGSQRGRPREYGVEVTYSF